ncbi:MAG: hypothetical protein SV765_08945 [Pseudomonadota bacterium]|nr:hypothetical protein [Pseudomonadota bacterium]
MPEKLTKIMLLGVIIIAGGCTTQPPPQPDAWVPVDPNRSIVVFLDDHAAATLERTTPLAEEMQQQLLSQLQGLRYDTAPGHQLTRDFLNHDGRRAPSEVADSLAMLDQWGYAVAVAPVLRAERQPQYQKVWVTARTTLYHIPTQRVLRRWEQTMPRHVVVSRQCDPECVRQNLTPGTRDWLASVAEQIHGSIDLHQHPRSEPVQPRRPSPPKPPPSPEPEPEVPGEKGQWNTINY